ncbi:MAG: NUDIX hydrolase [Eubacteriales bacterium]|nr:NUDIX hydrolase [Eubacteriales bacterium]
MEELFLELQDTQWPLDYINHDRQIARAIVIDENHQFYFIRVHRDDDFGKATLIETAGGGVEPNESVEAAIQRELHEELGAKVEILCKLGVVSDYYNKVHRHNINHYFLCKAIAFGATSMTQQEKEDFHLSTLCISYEQALQEYKTSAQYPLGKLLAQRELPVLQKAVEWLSEHEKKTALL